MKLGTHVDSGQMYCVYQNQAAATYLSLYFFSFLSLQFSNIKNFCCNFLRNCEAYKVETWYTCALGADVSCILESGCYAYLSLYFFSFLSLQFSNIKIFVALFSGTVRPIKFKLDTHVANRWMYRVYRNRTAASYLSLISLFFFLSNVQKLKIFVTLFSGTVRPRKFKLSTLVDSGWMCRVYQNQAAAAYLSLYFFIFLSLQLSNINIFCHTFLRNCEA